MENVRHVINCMLMIMALGWASSADGAIHLYARGQDQSDIYLAPGEPCTFEIYSDCPYPCLISYAACIGFDFPWFDDNFEYSYTTPEAGEMPSCFPVYSPGDFRGYVVSNWPHMPIGPGIHFIFDFAGSETGERSLMLYDPIRDLTYDVIHIHIIDVPVSGNVIYVDDDADGLNDGSSWENAFNDLQDALDVAADGEPKQIWVAQGTYYPTSSYGLEGDNPSRLRHFRMVNNVAIYGGFAGTETSLDERVPNRYVTTLSGDLLGNDDPATAVEDLVNDPNRADNCYHVFYHPGDFWLYTYSVLDGFTITGGSANEPHPSPHSMGGGMHNSWSSSPIITNCTFRGNSAYKYGGGMFNSINSPTVINCTFHRNSASEGGGMCNYGNTTVMGCAFIGNSSIDNGGGMWNYFSEPKVMNCTFSGNSANGDGGGIYSSAGSSSAITNCIIWGNTASSGSQVDGPATVRYSCVQGGYAGQGNIAEDPLFVDPNGVDGISGTEDDNVRLASNSPCIDTGDPDYLDPYNPTDLDGRNRIIDGDCDSPATVDMGAYEFGQVYIGDFAGGCDVNLADFAVMAAAWLASDSDTEWNPHCNLYDADLVIDVFDLRIFAAHWLEGT